MPLEDIDIGAPDPQSRPSGLYHTSFGTNSGPASFSSTASSVSYDSLTSPNPRHYYNSATVKSVANKQQYCVPDMGTVNYDLDDYIYEMECRQSDHTDGGDSEADLYSRLAQKEEDLILAAELGKALLERNELLVAQNEKLAEDYCHKLEILEQEKHGLRRKLTAKEGEYEVRVQELSVDAQCLKHELEDQQDHLRVVDREKSSIIEELTEQNTRLANQIKESNKREEQLSGQLRQLRDQSHLRRSNMSDQVSTLEMLKEEIDLLADKKLDLQRRIEGLQSEREGLSVNLDESTDRILMLERQSREKEGMLRNSQRDLEDLRHTNVSLTGRLEIMSRNSSSPSMGHTSLMNEIDMSDPEASRNHSSLPEDLLELEEDIECDEPLVPYSDAEALKQLRQEVIECTSQLRVLSDQLRHRRRNSLTSNSSDEFSIVHTANLKIGTLTQSVKEVQGLIREVLRREARGQECGECGRSSLDTKIIMEQEVHKANEELDKVKLELADYKEKLKTKTDESDKLCQQMLLRDAEFKVLEEQRNILKDDLSNTHMAKDELIKKAWDMRDSAVARKNSCEIELAKTRIDVMQVNSQLMEAVQQKIELSQQLEQWQLDMQHLLDENMRRKLQRLEDSGVLSNRNNGSDSDSSSSGKNSPKKNFKFLALLSALRNRGLSSSNNNNSSTCSNADGASGSPSISSSGVSSLTKN